MISRSSTDPNLSHTGDEPLDRIGHSRKKGLSAFAALFGAAFAIFAGQALGAPQNRDVIRTCKQCVLHGNGVVVGLNPRSDSKHRCPEAWPSLERYLQATGNGDFDKTVFEGRATAVLVIADLRTADPIARTVDLRLLSECGSEHLRGGVLLMTPLGGVDGRTYGMGQGVIGDCDRPERGVAGCIRAGGLIAHQP